MRMAQLLSTGTLDQNDTHQPLQDAVTYAKAGERLGWDEVWTTEHQFNPYVTNPCALTLASYLLGQTERLTVGTGVVVLPHTHPVRLASQAALLQQLSGGRLRLGLGRGSRTLELELFGDPDVWENGFPQALADLKGMLDSGAVDASVPLVPAPTATPLVVAATSESSVQTAAHHGVPFLLAFPFPDNVKTQLLDAYQSAAEAKGHAESPEHWLSVVVQVSDSREAARKILWERYVPWNNQATMAAPFLDAPRQTSLAQSEQMVELQAHGTPEDVAERLAELMELCGTENLVIIADPTLEPQQTLENLERIMTEVKPML